MVLKRLPPLRFGPWRLWWELQWKVQDAWVGVFWQNYPGKIYVWVCLLPCVPVHLEIWKPGTSGERRQHHDR